MISEQAKLVWRLLSGTPVEVFDEDTHEVWHSNVWELVAVRTEGEYIGTRTIGSANIISAYNLLHLHQLKLDSKVESLELFHAALEELQKANLVRKHPDRVRATFKTV